MKSPQNLGELGYNLQESVTRLLANKTLLKLLYYTDKDPLKQKDLTQTQIEKEVYNNLIRIVPRLNPQKVAVSQVAMRVAYGKKNLDNNTFMDITIYFEVFVPLTQWIIKDSNLRPFAIMGEIEKSLDKKNISGIGRMVSDSFQLNFLTDEMSCYQMSFSIRQYE